MSIEEVDDVIAVSNDDQVIAAEEDEGIIADDDDTSGDEDDEELTSLAIHVDVLDKNPKVGDEVRVKITVTNWGDNSADNVQAGFSFVDLGENPDSSFKLVDDGGYAVTPYDGGYVVDFGFMAAGETEEVILVFLATQRGTKKIVASVTSDDSIMEPDSYYDTNITVSGDSSSADNSKAKSSASKTLPATGNPLALLALALFCIVPYYRRR